nr:MAG TPA: hypothetical protein [Caudoviricetes sp.]
MIFFLTALKLAVFWWLHPYVSPVTHGLQRFRNGATLLVSPMQLQSGLPRSGRPH